MHLARLFRRRTERFAQLIDDADGGRRRRARSPVDSELARLAAISDRIRAARSTIETDRNHTVDPDYRVSLRTMLIAQAEREGIGVTATAGPGVPEPRPVPPAPTWASLRPALTVTRARARTAVISMVAAGAIAVSGMSAASENALPGDTLYGFKLSTERAQLALAKSELRRATLFFDFAHTRYTEATEVRGNHQGFVEALDAMDANTRAAVRLLTATAVRRQDSSPLDSIDTFLGRHRHLVTGLLDGATRAERERVNRSLTLLDAVRERAADLRVAMTCPVQSPARSDSLGPLPQPCPVDRNAVGTGMPAEDGPTEQETEDGRSEADPPPRRPARTSPRNGPGQNDSGSHSRTGDTGGPTNGGSAGGDSGAGSPGNRHPGSGPGRTASNSDDARGAGNSHGPGASVDSGGSNNGPGALVTRTITVVGKIKLAGGRGPLLRIGGKSTR